MSSIDYSSLLSPSSNKNIDFNEILSLKTDNFTFANDIFEFIESPKYIGEEIFPMQKELLQEYYFTVDENKNRIYQEMVLISGMRSGKTKMAGWMAAYELHKLLEILEKGSTFAKYYKDRGVSIGIGQRIYIVVVAAALDQAEGTIFSAIKGLVENANWFVRFVKYLRSKKQYSADKFELRFFNALHVKAEDSNSATQVGKTIHTLIFDEMSRMDVADSEIARKTQKASAQMVYQGLSKGTTTFKNDRNVIIISAPVFEDDYGMQMLLGSGKLTCCTETEDVIQTMSKKYPLKINSRLGHHSTTFAFNPTIDRNTDSFILGVKHTSPLAYKRDYLALPPSGVNVFFDMPEKIDACITEFEKPMIKEINYQFEESVVDVNGNTIKRFYVGKSPEDIQSNNFTSYFMCCDAAVRKDNFAFGIGHGEWVVITDSSGKSVRKSKTVIDYLTMWKPDKQKGIEVNLDNVISFITVIKKHMHIQALTFDQWNADLFLQRMHSIGIVARQLPITMIMWEKLRERVNNGLLAIPHTKHGTLIDPTQPEKGTQYDLVIQEMKKLQLINGKEVNHAANFSKDIADVVARINYLVDESVSGIDYQTKGVDPSDFINRIGGSDQFKESLRQLAPLFEMQNNTNSGNGRFFATGGGSGRRRII